MNNVLLEKVYQTLHNFSQYNFGLNLAKTWFKIFQSPTICILPDQIYVLFAADKLYWLYRMGQCLQQAQLFYD